MNRWKRKAVALTPGDGFDDAEMQAARKSSTSEWKPAHEYTEKKIRDLVTGPARIRLSGKVVHLQDQKTPSEGQYAAKGYLKVTIQDHTGLLKVHRIS